MTTRVCEAEREGNEDHRTSNRRIKARAAMEVDEVPRSSGRFNLDRAAQEHMNEGLEVWIPTEPVSSVRGLEAQPIRPLMVVTMPGYTPSSTTGSSQISGSSSRLKELQDKLQLRSRDGSRHDKSDLPPGGIVQSRRHSGTRSF